MHVINLGEIESSTNHCAENFLINFETPEAIKIIHTIGFRYYPEEYVRGLLKKNS